MRAKDRSLGALGQAFLIPTAEPAWRLGLAVMLRIPPGNSFPQSTLQPPNAVE